MTSAASSAVRRTSPKTARTARQKRNPAQNTKASRKASTRTQKTESVTVGEIGAKQQARSKGGGAQQVSPGASAAVKYDTHKADYSLLTRAMLEPMTRALMYGERKYSRGNFRLGFDNVRLTSAALRHIFAYLDREEFDLESGVSHLGHAMAALAMLLDNNEEGVSTDVRYEKADPTGPSW